MVKRHFKSLSKALSSWQGSISFLISIAAFAMSSITFYLTSLQNPKVTIYTSDLIDIGYDGKSNYEFFMVPLTAINKGGSTGAIAYFLLNVVHLDSGDSRLFESTYFVQNNKIVGSYKPMAISANSSDSKEISFYPVDRANKNNILAKQGTYQATVGGYSGESSAPLTAEKIYFFVTQSEQTQIANNMQPAKLMQLRTAKTAELLDKSPSHQNIYFFGQSQ